MSVFNGKRLTNKTFKIDVERMRRGWYSDKYFENINRMLEQLSHDSYTIQQKSPRSVAMNLKDIPIGDMEVEAQWFTRRKPFALIGGVDKALSMLRHCTGYFDDDDKFIDAWNTLEVEAIEDGMFTHYNNDPLNVQPVLKIRGIYRYFSMLETPTLGVLTRISRIATNVYNTLVAANGKQVLFFPARFDLHEVQAADGYANDLAVQRYNMDYHGHLRSLVSTDAQADWWGGDGGGTVPHAVIACFLANTSEAMLCFASSQPLAIPRIALVDFNNDCVGTSVAVARVLFERYRELKEAGDEVEAEKFRLTGVRLDTSGTMRDVSIDPLGDPKLDLGVNPRLVVAVRRALNNAWHTWDLPEKWQSEAKNYCEGVQIVATGGFTPERIRNFEQLGVPVDVYGVGSSLMANDDSTKTDFTTDVVRLKIHNDWIDMAKVGRVACDNPDLAIIPVDYDG